MVDNELLEMEMEKLLPLHDLFREEILLLTPIDEELHPRRLPKFTFLEVFSSEKSPSLMTCLTVVKHEDDNLEDSEGTILVGLV